MATKNYRLEPTNIIGTNMDLSFQGLMDIPLREMALYRQVNTLDLSNNNLRFLSDDFPETMSQLKRLDLSRNLLVKLPETIGKMTNLCHLDICKNKIERLPMSFSYMNKLRWLNVQENPLVEPLIKICGECLDTAECNFCAKNLFHFMCQVEQLCISEKSNKPTNKNDPSLSLTPVVQEIAQEKNISEHVPTPFLPKQLDTKIDLEYNDINLSHEECIKINKVKDDNIVVEGFGKNGGGIINSDIKKLQEIIHKRGKTNSKGKRMIPRSRTGIHQGIKTTVVPVTTDTGLIGQASPNSPWSHLITILKWIKNIFLFLTIGLLTISIITAMIIDYRVIEKKITRWTTSSIIPVTTCMDIIRKYQNYIQSLVTKCQYFPIVPYIEPNFLMKSIYWIWDIISSSFSSVASIFNY